MLKILNVFGKIINVIAADGSDRLKLAIENVIYMAFAVLCAWGIYELIEYLEFASVGGCSGSDVGYFFLAILGIIICFSVGLYTLIAGIVAQAVLLVCAIFGSIFSDEKGANAIALLIAVISIGAATVGALCVFGVIQF